jgi:hypothetical protein
MYVQICALVMRLLVLAVAITPTAIGVKAADLALQHDVGSLTVPVGFSIISLLAS